MSEPGDGENLNADLGVHNWDWLRKEQWVGGW